MGKLWKSIKSTRERVANDAVRQIKSDAANKNIPTIRVSQQTTNASSTSKPASAKPSTSKATTPGSNGQRRSNNEYRKQQDKKTYPAQQGKIGEEPKEEKKKSQKQNIYSKSDEKEDKKLALQEKRQGNFYSGGKEDDLDWDRMEKSRQEHRQNAENLDSQIEQLRQEGQTKSQIWVDGIYMGEDKQTAETYSKRIADLQKKADAEWAAIGGRDQTAGEKAVGVLTGAGQGWLGPKAKFYGSALEDLALLGEKIGSNTSDYAGWATDEMSAAQIGQENDPQKRAQQIQETRDIQEFGRRWNEEGQQKIEKAKDGKGFLGDVGIDLAANYTQTMLDKIPEMLLPGGGGMISLYTRSAGAGMLEAEAEGATRAQAKAYGMTVGAIEAATEKMFGGFAKIYGKGSADDLVESVVRKLAKTREGRQVLLFGADVVGEAIEEVASNRANPFAKAIYDKGESLKKTYTTWEGFKESVSDDLYSALIGGLMGGLGGAGKVRTGEYSRTATKMSLQDAMDEINQQSQEPINDGVLNMRTFLTPAIDETGAPSSDQNAIAMAGLKGNAKAFLNAKLTGETSGPILGDILNPDLVARMPGQAQLAAQAFANTAGAEEATQNVLNYISDIVLGADGGTPLEWNDAKSDAATGYVLATLATKFQGGMEVAPKNQQAIAQEAVEFAEKGYTLEEAIDIANQTAQKQVTATPAAPVVEAPAAEAPAQPQPSNSMDNGTQGSWQNWMRDELFAGGEVSDRDIDRILRSPAAREAFTDVTGISLEDMSDAEAREAIGLAAGSTAQAATTRVEAPESISGAEGTNTQENAGNAAETGLNRTESQAERKPDTARAKPGSGTVSYDGAVLDGKEYAAVDKGNLTRTQKNQISALETMAKATGVNIVFYQSKMDSEGRYLGANGAYKDGTLYLDVNAGLNKVRADGTTAGEIAIVRTAAHELTHFIQDFNEADYGVMRDYIVDELLNKTGSKGLDELIDTKIKRAHGTITRAQALDEVIADGCEMMLKNTKAVENLAKENMTLARRIGRWIKQWTRKITEAFEGVDVHNEEARILMQNAEKLQKMWDDALIKAVGNQKSESGVNSGGVEINDNTPEGVVSVDASPVVSAISPKNGSSLIQYQARTEQEALPKQIFTVKGESRMLVDETGKIVDLSVRDIRNAVAQANGMSAENIAKVNQFLDQVEKKMKGYKLKYRFVGLQDIDNATILMDRNGNIVLSAMVKNDEYAVNFDFTKLCKKRQALQQVIEVLAREKGRASENGTTEVDLSAENVQRINEMLAASGVETNCLGCFVEAKRANQQQLNGYILDDWNAIVDEVAPDAGYFHYADAEGEVNLHDSEEDKAAFDKYREALSKLDAERRKEGKRVTPTEKARLLIENVPAARKKLTYSDIGTERGRTRLHQEFPEIDSFAKARLGTASFKTVESFAPYNAEVELLGQKSVKVKDGKLVVQKDDGSVRKELAKIGGARSQSFSDFIISHVYDVLQKTAALDARGLPGHTYTKEISRASLFGKTGEKHNMSVLFEVDPAVDSWSAGLTKGGNYFVGDYQHFMLPEGQEGKAHFIQSIGFEDAKKLQNTDGYSKNCGIIAVPLSYRAYKKALADPDVRMIIGYHSSGMPVEVKSKTHYDKAADYQGVQNTQKVVKLVKPNYEIPEDIPSYATPPSDVKPIKGGSKTTKSDMTFDIKGRFEELSAGKTGDSRTAAAKQTLQEFLDFMDENGLTAVTSKAEGGYGKFALYDDVEKTRDPYLTADHYIEYCIEKGELPLFWEFATDQNYYKQLYDFNMFDRLTYNSETGRHEDMPGREAYAPQEAVHLLDSNGELQVPKDFFKQLEKYTADYNYQMQKVSEVVPRVLEAFKNESGTTAQKAGLETDGDEEAEATVNNLLNESAARFSDRDMPEPKNTQYGFKLMNVDKEGKPHAMFIDADKPYEFGKWIPAASPQMGNLEKLEPGYAYEIDENDNADMKTRVPVERVTRVSKAGKKSTVWKGLPGVTAVNNATNNGKRWMVISEYANGKKSYHNVGISGSGTVATFALRPGFHAVDAPSMWHIGAKSDSSLPKPDMRRPDQRWFLIEYPVDVDYNQEAFSNPDKDIQDHLPENGWYSFQTNSGAEKKQHWFITGGIKIVGAVTEEDARRYAKERGIKEDLPWKQGKAYSDDDAIDLDEYIRTTKAMPTPSKAEMYDRIVNGTQLQERDLEEEYEPKKPEAPAPEAPKTKQPTYEPTETAAILAEASKTKSRSPKGVLTKGSGRVKVSQFYSNTQTKSGVASLVHGGKYYNVKPEAESLANAATRLKKDYKGMIKHLVTAEAWSGEMADAAWIVEEELLKDYARTGDKTALDMWQKIQSEKRRESARAVQATAKMSRPGAAVVIRGIAQELEAARAANEEAKKAGKTDNIIPEEVLKRAETKANEIANRMLNLEIEIDDRIDAGMGEAEAKEKSKEAYLDLIDEINAFRHVGLLQDASINEDIRNNVKTLSTNFRQRLAEEGMEYIQRFAACDAAGITEDIHYKGKKDFLKRLNTWQKLAQLTGTGTWGRNGVGNGSFGIVDVLANNSIFTRLADAMLSAKTGKRSTGREFGILNSSARDAARHALNRSILEVAANIDLAEDGQTKYDMGRSRTYDPDGKAFERMVSRWEQWNGYMLQSSDAWFKGMAEGSAEAAIRRANSWGKDNLTDLERRRLSEDDAKKLTKERQKEIDETKKQVAEYRTFQNDGWAADKANKLRDALNKAGHAPIKFFTGKDWQRGQFGLGTALMPYTKVPTNLGVKALEFSPAGALKGLAEMLKVANDPKATMAQQNQAVTDFGRGMTGTVLIGVLAKLMKRWKWFKDWEAEEDKDVKAQNKAEGKSGIQINLSMLQRCLSGDEDETWRNGDNVVDISSMEPVNQLFTTASLIAEGMKPRQALFTSAKDNLLGIPALQQLQNIENNIKYTDTPEDGWQTLLTTAASTAGSVAGGMIPAPLRHAGTAADEYARDTSGKNAMERAWNQTLSSIPGARKTLPVKTDAFGNKITSGDAATRVANQYLPFKHSQVNQSDASREIERLRKKTGENLMPSRTGPKTVQYGDRKVELDTKERNEYKNDSGQEYKKAIESLMKSPVYSLVDDKTKAAMVAELESYSKEEAKEDLAKKNKIDYESKYSEFDDLDQPELVIGTKAGYNNAKNKENWRAMDNILDAVSKGNVSEGDRDYLESEVQTFWKMLDMHEQGVSSKKVHQFEQDVKERYTSEFRTDANGSDILAAVAKGVKEGKLTLEEADALMGRENRRNEDNIYAQLDYEMKKVGKSDAQVQQIWKMLQQFDEGDVEKSAIVKKAIDGVPKREQQRIKNVITSWTKTRATAGKGRTAVYNAMRSASPDYTPADVQKFWYIVDANGNGTLTKKEFNSALSRIPSEYRSKVKRSVYEAMGWK